MNLLGGYKNKIYKLSYRKFCIYTHPVNSKSTIWHSTSHGSKINLPPTLYTCKYRKKKTKNVCAETHTTYNKYYHIRQLYGVPYAIQYAIIIRWGTLPFINVHADTYMHRWAVTRARSSIVSVRLVEAENLDWRLFEAENLDWRLFGRGVSPNFQPLRVSLRLGWAKRTVLCQKWR